MSLTNGRSGAVFGHDEGRIALFASRGIDQHVLDAANTVWAPQRETVQSGQPFYVPDVNTERRLPKADGTGPVSFVMVPVMGAEGLSAVLYVDSFDPHFCTSQDLERLSKFSRIIAKAVGENEGVSVDRAPSRAEAWGGHLGRTPVEDMERGLLLLLLNRNGW